MIDALLVVRMNSVYMKFNNDDFSPSQQLLISLSGITWKRFRAQIPESFDMGSRLTPNPLSLFGFDKRHKIYSNNEHKSGNIRTFITLRHFFFNKGSYIHLKISLIEEENARAT